MDGEQENIKEVGSIDFLSLPIVNLFSKYFAPGKKPIYYWLRFSGLFLLLWAPGLLVSHLSGSFLLYLTDWAHVAYDAMTCIGLLLLINLCRQTTTAIYELDEVVNHTRDKEFSTFLRDWNRNSLIWYSLCIITPIGYSICMISFNLLGLPHGPVPPWVDWQGFGTSLPHVSLTTARVNSFYWTYESFLNQLILGIGFNRFAHYFIFINDYGKKYLDKKSIDLLNPQDTEGVKPFSRLVVKSTFFCSLPLALSSLVFFERVVFRKDISVTWLITIAVCVSLFVVTFFYQMKWVRSTLLNSKTQALSIIDEEIQKARRRIAEDLGAFSDLVSLFAFRDRLKKTHTWAVDTEMLSKFFLAILIPILGGAIVQIVLERLLGSLAS